MLVNLSNHPSSTWEKKQIDAAQTLYKNIVDIDFPEINPTFSPIQIQSAAHQCVDKCLELIENSKYESAVHVMGEHTFTLLVVSLLKQHNIKCIASTSQRISTTENNKKVTQFQFVQFREYII